MHIRPSVYKLKGKVQHYQWGGFEFISNLLGRAKNGQPYAEYWLGAHPLQPAEVEVHGHLKKLNELIESDKAYVLGPAVAARFESLPYLLKVLDVRQMLSIQVHPDKASAAAAFDTEKNQNIPLDAPHRNYKDRNHKPELMVALSDFWLLHGFKPEQALRATLEAVPDFQFLQPIFENESYQGLYKKVMTMPQADVNAVLQPLLARLRPLYENGELPKDSEDFWAARAAQTFCKGDTCDRGIFSIYFFNLVHLKTGEGIYQAAGLPHAYLEGQNVEIMAASDNVLRAGLTDKHIDIGELMKHVQFEQTVPNVLPDTGERETVYKSPAAEFELSRIVLSVNETLEIRATSAEIVLLIAGIATLQAPDETIALKQGDAAMLPAGTTVKVAGESEAQLFRATVPAS